MARGPRIAAHLGRPETPDEAAARKAENSLNYRRSKTVKNLVFALALTLGVVAVVIWGVPRGELPASPPIDVAAVAENVEAAGHDPIVPGIPESWRTDRDAWRVNVAQLETGATATWNIVYVPDDAGFLRFAQAFDADETWAAQTLGGSAPTGTITIDGVEWDVYELSRAERNANVSYALGTQAGADHVLLYGSATPETTADLADLVADQVRALQSTSAEEER